MTTPTKTATPSSTATRHERANQQTAANDRNHNYASSRRKVQVHQIQPQFSDSLLLLLLSKLIHTRCQHTKKTEMEVTTALHLVLNSV